MICACRPLGYLLEMFMLIFCICCAGVMIVMVTGKPHLIDDGKISNQQIMMWILFTVILIMAMVALKKILGRFMRAASTAGKQAIHFSNGTSFALVGFSFPE